jgi:hypothetical protein
MIFFEAFDLTNRIQAFLKFRRNINFPTEINYATKSQRHEGFIPS